MAAEDNTPQWSTPRDHSVARDSQSGYWQDYAAWLGAYLGLWLVLFGLLLALGLVCGQFA